jgi:hypothetical protein
VRQDVLRASIPSLLADLFLKLRDSALEHATSTFDDERVELEDQAPADATRATAAEARAGSVADLASNEGPTFSCSTPRFGSSAWVETSPVSADWIGFDTVTGNGSDHLPRRLMWCCLAQHAEFAVEGGQARRIFRVPPA